MGKIMEAIFCVLYIITVVILGTWITVKGKNKKEYFLFGLMSLVLVFGDAFHLVPRIMVAVNPAGDYHVSLGIGKLITSITMTLFYLMMYFIYGIRYNFKNKMLTISMIILTVSRIGLCFHPGNDWTGDAPVFYGIIRNIPFTVMGLIMIILYFRKRSDKSFKWMWLAITLSFLFYLPVVLWADVHPMIGMFMMPKTCMYVWAVVMGFLAVKRQN